MRPGFRSFHLSRLGPCAGAVRARVPAKPMKSVYEREPRGREKQKVGPAGGSVRARVPVKPMKSVFKREPRGREKQKSGPKGAPQRAGQ